MPSDVKVALITGGASGMGLAVTKRLVELGWNVSILDFNQERGNDVANTIGAQSWGKWGRLDFVYANAGIGDRIDWYAPAKELPNGAPEKPDSMVVDICLQSAIWCSYLALHYFRKNSTPSGKLVFTSSQCGLYPGERIPLYTAAKHGVVGLTRAMGLRLSQTGEPITVNCVCPGLVPTNIMPDAITDVTPAEYVTPLSTVVRAVEGFVLDENNVFQGQIAECSAQSVSTRPPNEYKDDATRYIYSDAAASKANTEELMKQIVEKRSVLEKSIAGTVAV